MAKIILYHGTSKSAGEKILKEGFKPDKTYNWKIKSKKGFVYLSLAYGPFYAIATKSSGNKGMLIKVIVDEKDLYPDDDFVMYALKKPVYNKAEFDRINLEDFKNLSSLSLKYMGNACAKPEDIEIIDGMSFDMAGLIHACDPTITPLNYLIMGDYYKKLSHAIYSGELKHKQDYVEFWHKFHTTKKEV